MLGLPCWADFSLVVASGSYSPLVVHGISSHTRMCGLQKLKLPGCSTQAQQLWFMGLVAPQHVESSQTKLEPMSPALEVVSLSLSHKGSFLSEFLMNYTYITLEKDIGNHQ